MATSPRTATITLEEYLAAEDVAEERSEFVDGQVVAMVGGSVRHNRIIHNLHLALGNALRGGPCGMMSQGMKVKAAPRGNVLYPDVVVYCGEPEVEHRGGEVLLNPVLIVEVLSPSTADYDYGTKWQSYRTIPSLQEYLLVAQDEPRVEVYARHAEHFWLFGEFAGLQSEVHLASLGTTLKLADIYDGVLPAAPDPRGQR